MSNRNTYITSNSRYFRDTRDVDEAIDSCLDSLTTSMGTRKKVSDKPLDTKIEILHDHLNTARRKRSLNTKKTSMEYARDIIVSITKETYRYDWGSEDLKDRIRHMEAYVSNVINFIHHEVNYQNRDSEIDPLF